MISQKDAVFNVIKQVLHKNNINVEFSSQRVEDVLTSEYREQIIRLVINGFKEGSIPITRDVVDVNKYASTLISNYLRKDSRLNGGFLFVNRRKYG